MAWEWVYDSKGKQWTLNVGGWNAVVQRGEGPKYLWQGYIQHEVDPHERYDSPKSEEAVTIRAWCLTKIAELRNGA